MKNILIIKPSSLGDIVQSLPVAARLRDCLPDAKISWLLNAPYRRLLEKSPCVDHLFLFQRNLWRAYRNVPEAVSSFLALCRLLRGARFDAVLDLQGLLRSGMLAGVTGAAIRVGFRNAREGARFFYTEPVDVPNPEMHSVDRYLLLPAALGFERGDVCFPLGIGKEERDWAERALRAVPSPAAGLFPAARWKTKRWPPESFARLGDILSDEGIGVVIIGGFSGEASGVKKLMKRGAVVLDSIEDPLRMAAVMERLGVLVSNDSGPMHIAAAVAAPVVALFGPTNHLRTGPWGSRNRVIISPVACRPCYRRECDKGDECMRSITVESVRRAVMEIVSPTAQPI